MSRFMVTDKVRVMRAISTTEDEPAFAGRAGIVMALGEDYNGMHADGFDCWVAFRATHGVVSAAFKFDELELGEPEPVNAADAELAAREEHADATFQADRDATVLGGAQ